jgi:hypothetical protein
MSYSVANNSVPADTSTGKSMKVGGGGKMNHKGFLAAPGPCANDSAGVPVKTAGVVAGGNGKAGTGMPKASSAPLMSGGINKPAVVDSPSGKAMKTGKGGKMNRGTYLAGGAKA